MFVWHEEKNQRNIEKHRLDFELAEWVFAGPCVTQVDPRDYGGEQRWITFGELDGRVVVIAHTTRGSDTRIISMRKANRREQKTYKARVSAARRPAR